MPRDFSLNPPSQAVNLIRTQRWSFGRHFLFFYHLQQQAILRLTPDDGGAALPSSENAAQGAQVQACFAFFDPMALDAVLTEERRDLLLKMLRSPVAGRERATG